MNNSEDNLTPQPWEVRQIKLYPSHNGPKTRIVSKTTNEIVVTTKTEEDAKLIVRAVNNFDALLEACKKASSFLMQDGKHDSDDEYNALQDCLKAISNATK